jgi:uncharacterized membrane protein YkvA (DUF1232 family)
VNGSGALAWVVPGVAGVLLAWVALVLMLWRVAGTFGSVSESMRLLPDFLRLVTRLARDETVPWVVRLRLWVLLGYLALPIDVVPDFIPVVGYADDVGVVLWVLRSVVRRVGSDALERQWSGSAQGLAAVRRLCGIGG